MPAIRKPTKRTKCVVKPISAVVEASKLKFGPHGEEYTCPFCNLTTNICSRYNTKFMKRVCDVCNANICHDCVEIYKEETPPRTTTACLNCAETKWRSDAERIQAERVRIASKREGLANR